jgi:Flp pilus assembly protein TadB
MIAVLLLGVITGLGSLGIVYGLHRGTPSLEAVARTMSRPLPSPWMPSTTAHRDVTISTRAGEALLAAGEQAGLLLHPRWQALLPSLDITGVTAAQLGSQVLLGAGAGLLLPPALWLSVQFLGVGTPALILLVGVALAVPVGLILPVVTVLRRARDRRRHFRVVIGTFIDLVVLSLAGGVGIEGAVVAASQVSADWAERRMARALSTARDAGQSPWVALGRLGEQLAVPELAELSTTLQLAGTEGARIRQALHARAVSLRRHEQADAESEANAATERMFLPGALLLVGFLLFVGYPAFSRLLGGF